MTTYDKLFGPMLTAAGALAILLAAMGLMGCETLQTPDNTAQRASSSKTKYQQDREAILGMAGEYDVLFDFRETVALRDGYELKDPYHAEASEKVLIIADEPGFISLQHLLVVSHDGETHVIKHWRQDWQYESAEGYDFEGGNVWTPLAYDADATEGAWVQSVYQVDDSPRYWGVGRWEHRDGVSTWSAPTNRPLPRREFSKRDDYQVLGAVNTHVVTPAGWMHYQSNHKIDKAHPTQPVIALESGVNTYTKTTDTDFTKADEYWQKTAPYWAQVRAAWADVYDARGTIRLQERWKGDTLFTHLFDLSDLYWGKTDAAAAREQIDEVIDAFMQPEQVAQP
ncbi:MAG: DUF6607 family protein [Phycisphaeraceae bacterium]